MTRDVKASRPVWPQAKLFGLGFVVSGLGLDLMASGLGLVDIGLVASNMTLINIYNLVIDVHLLEKLVFRSATTART